MIKVGFGKDDGILGRASPCLHEVNSITTTQGGVSCEHHTRRLVYSPQSSMHIGEVLETTTADKLGGQEGGKALMGGEGRGQKGRVK